MASTSSARCYKGTVRSGFILIICSFGLLYTGQYWKNKLHLGKSNQSQRNGRFRGNYERGDSEFSHDPRHICQCRFRVEPMVSENRTNLMESSCSDEATLLGEYQNIVSYSLYLLPTVTITSDNHYFYGAAANLDGIKKYYPGWFMRIYSDVTLKAYTEICALICSDPIIQYCDVTRLPGLGNLDRIDPMRWRFLPMGDPTVDKFVVRDLDSRISQRERDAVSEWEASNYSFHGMRDHWAHGTRIMGGMWGGDNYKIGYKKAKNLQKQIIESREPGIDQNILSTLIYQPHKKQILTHDSYLCRLYKDSRPFPTRRASISFYVGKRFFRNATKHALVERCPTQCRPPDHQDWEYC